MFDVGQAVHGESNAKKTAGLNTSVPALRLGHTLKSTATRTGLPTNKTGHSWLILIRGWMISCAPDSQPQVAAMAPKVPPQFEWCGNEQQKLSWETVNKQLNAVDQLNHWGDCWG